MKGQRWAVISLVAAVGLLGFTAPSQAKSPAKSYTKTDKRSEKKAKRPTASKERERMDVQEVFGTSDGEYVVLLKTRTMPTRYLPIWIGEMEALAIRMRLDRRNPPRPLTLNLLESIIDGGRIKVTEIAIDSLKGGVFLGTVHLKQNGRLWHVDARPSDAIGLAVGEDAPIWVTQEVLRRAGLELDDFDGPSKEPDKNTGYEETL